jgi:Fic family protein
MISNLPPADNYETINILKALNKASRSLAELKGEAKTIPNENILINTLGLQEAKDSSEIENIITTQDDIFRASVDSSFKNIAAKEVQNYIEALKLGYQLIKKYGLLTANNIKDIQKRLEPNKPGFRKIPGTVLKNANNDVIYTPPQDYKQIVDLMSNLEKYINDNEFQNIDPLIKMPIIHYQFESIHPFYDGNGRTGRIINILYLVQQGLLDIPVLYLSRYINQNKSDYYKYLQSIRKNNDYESWIIWMLNGITKTAQETIILVQKIRLLMENYINTIKEAYPKMYSKDLVENIFKHPYTKIEHLMNDLQVTRPTANKYLNKLINLGLLKKQKLWKTNYYINEQLYKLFNLSCEKNTFFFT